MEPGLGDGHHPVADVAVPRDSNLPGENHVFADMRRSGEPHLGAQQCIFAH